MLGLKEEEQDGFVHRKQKWRQFELSSQFILVIGAKIRTRDRNKFISSECCLVKKTHIIFCMLKQFSCFRMRDGNRLSPRRVELLDCPWSGYGFSTGAIPGFNPVHREAIEDFAHSLVSLSFIFLFRYNSLFLIASFYLLSGPTTLESLHFPFQVRISRKGV